MGITRLNVIKDEDLDYRMNTINEEFLESVQYSILRYQRDERLKGGCHNMQFKLTDDSIFIETHGYPMQNESLMDRCINNLLNLSFERLKSKIEQNTNQQILKIKFITDDLSLKQKKIQNRIKKKEKNKNDTNIMYTELCRNLASYSLNGTGGTNFVNKSESISNSDLFQNILHLSTMMRQCDEINFLYIDKEIENLMKTEGNLQKAKNILINSDFLDVFKIEILSTIIEHNTSYISKKYSYNFFTFRFYFWNTFIL